ncbi:Methanogen homoaconitase small subunit [Candidatus Gugararchaeum adminiculabundum]|nr:Methanogen homoaconitase small subunit [Candidatus Gugararchaeum adminiculabundum]
MTKIVQIAGKAVPIRGDDIDTDRITPARFLKTTTFDEEFLKGALFADDRKILGGKKFSGASVMIVNKNFGCGSSREHSPQAIKAFGIKALIGVSFAEIFASNCEAIGLVTVRVSERKAVELQAFVEEDPEAIIEIDLQEKLISYGDLDMHFEISEGARQNFLHGTWNITKTMVDAISETRRKAGAIPYVNGFKKN